MKNTVYWINNRLHIGEEKLGGIEDLVRETIQKAAKIEQNIVCSIVGQLQAAKYMCNGVSKGMREGRTEKTFEERMAETFPNLMILQRKEV